MKIEQFIQNEITRRLHDAGGVLVVYDPQRRYRDLCLALATPQRRVIDASASSIESREAALVALRELGRANASTAAGALPDSLLVYVPAKSPLTDEEKQRDPFAIYIACGGVFPASDSDEYINLCLKAKADFTADIRGVFQNTANPSFDMIDAVGGGVNWPQLQALLKVESALDILFALLVPTDKQKDALKGQPGWVPEVKTLLQNTLGMALITHAKSLEPISNELWRFILFSEFVVDLPVALPDTLSNVPRARTEAQPLIEALCDRLRSTDHSKAPYIDHAETIQTDMNLPVHCKGIQDLGVRDTFPFEERSFFSQAIDALKRDDMDKVRALLGRLTTSLWGRRGENQAQWQLLEAAVRLIEACEDAARQLPDHARSQNDLIDYYVSSMRTVDQLQREFEQTASDQMDATDIMAGAVAQARAAYRRLAEKAQAIFIRHLEKSGWPPAGRLSNTDVFDKLIAPKLQESGRRVAVFMIDALRYELGMELHRNLAEVDMADIQPAFAQLPTVTPVGMAGLLPGAGQGLKLVNRDGQLGVLLGDQSLATVTQRMDVLKKRYGQRFFDVRLSDFIHSKATLPSAVDLLVLRSNEVDAEFESSAEPISSAITKTFRHIRQALIRLRGLGFEDAIIVTDHGFYMNTTADPGAAVGTQAGDVCIKPTGNWVNIHDRLLLGDGTGDSASFVLPADSLGMRGDFHQAAGPRALVAYKANQWYFHGGASLQETIVPVIAVRLRTNEPKPVQRPTIQLTYKRGSKRITTRFPVVELNIAPVDMFSLSTPFDVLLEAHDKQGNVVGEARPGGLVNPATGTISVQPGTIVPVTIKMHEDYEGKFIVKVLDPATLTTYAKIELETDYTV